MKSITRLSGASALALLALLTITLPAEAHAAEGSSRPSREQVAAARQACREDVTRLCDGVQKGGGRILGCLREHAPELSATCHQALTDAGALRVPAPDGGAAR